MQKYYNIEKIKKYIDKYEYVSFDVFDTLIKRNVSVPKDLFRLVELEYNKNNNVKINNFFYERINAETKAKKNCYNGECNIDEIYNEMKNIYPTTIINQLKRLEIKLEIDYSVRNQNFYPIYEYCVKQRKKILIISDMYLFKETIEKILTKNGITCYEDLFVSSETRLSKRNGKIYPYVLEKLKIKKNEMIHIGDSKRADFIMPIKSGITAYLIPKKTSYVNFYNSKMYEKLNDSEKLSYRTIESFINNNIKINKNEYYKIGYEVLGPLLYGFTKWLIRKFKEEKIEKVFFLSREGLCLKKAFEILNKNDNTIQDNYLYVSRRSTRTPLLENINTIEDVFSIVKMKHIIDLKSFFINVGLNIENYDKLLKKYNCKEETNIKRIKNFNELFEEIKNDIIDNSIRESQNIVGYLKQEKFKGKLAIVDVGWEGTMQNSLLTLNKKHNLGAEIYGFYLGQSQAAKKYIQNGIKTYAYLFDYTSNEYNDIRPFLNLFESFFLAQHGTTMYYQYNRNSYNPVLDKCEYSKDEKDIFKKIQDGAFDFIYDYNESNINAINFYPSISSLNIKKLGLNPSLKNVKLFGNINYLETKKYAFAKPKSIFYYIFHFKQLYIDFCNSSWKIGFLKRLLKINLNYYKLYEKINNMKKR